MIGARNRPSVQGMPLGRVEVGLAVHSGVTTARALRRTRIRIVECGCGCVSSPCYLELEIVCYVLVLQLQASPILWASVRLSSVRLIGGFAPARTPTRSGCTSMSELKKASVACIGLLV